MSRIQSMRARLARFDPVALEIGDDSARHAGHAGANGGGHFTLRIVSGRFAGLNTLARHRMIYCALGEMMQGEIHALNIQAKTPDEN